MSAMTAARLTDALAPDGTSGGTAVFTDLGAGKGGHLAWIDLNEP